MLTVLPGVDDYEGRREAAHKIGSLQRALVESARADFGLDAPTPPRSLLGKLLAWPGN